jgi:NDP-sugar pyrophosphorylase family protein
MDQGFWRTYFQAAQNKLARYNMTNLIPAAGRGKRFRDSGYTLPKPMIPIDEKPMILQSVRSLPDAEKWIFVCLEDHLKRSLEKAIRSQYPGSTLISVKETTQGMLNTCLLAERYLELKKPLLISACDYDLRYDEKAFDKLVNDKTIDAAIWTFRNHEIVSRNPDAYAYTSVDENGNVTKISEKKPISDSPENDNAVVSVFYFKSAAIFLYAARKLIESRKTINNEYYVATSINELIAAGKKVVPFEVEKFVCWGTPEDLKEYEYWKGVFA